MAHNKQSILTKIDYLENELRELKDYFYVNATYDFLIKQLDSQQVLLKEIEVEERFAAIDAEEAEEMEEPD